ncbi:Transcription regulator, AsnC-type [mine drainage metagenome]|uniref:Transcription regulator, AsnC-type n=1 Tax=mine drainage metagenome TaxID=410659 RepID=T0ZHR7_9ZZZZ
MKVDALDRKILAVLQNDAQASYDRIAEILHRSPSTVRDRIAHMERAGVIRGYCAVIDPQSVGLGTEALVFCNMPSDREDEVASACLSLPPVLRVFHVSGERRTVLRVAVPDTQALWRFIAIDLKSLGIVDIDVKVILRTWQRFPPELLPTETPQLPFSLPVQK